VTDNATTGSWECGVPHPGAEHRRLGVLIGRWINEGETVPADGASGVRIVTSEVCEWIPGPFAVLHAVYGRIGDVDVGGLETIGYDSESDKSHHTSSTARTT
jgi:hypothetical protein